jgi:DnaJ-domain-containing protein 1
MLRGVGIVLLAGGIGTAAAQPSSSAMTGIATNLGIDGVSEPVRGQLEVSLSPVNGGPGLILVSPPLGGSGVTRTWTWTDTILIASFGINKDTIVWIATVENMTGSMLRGSYTVTGGSTRGQVGTWILDGSQLLPRLRGIRPRELGSVFLAGVGRPALATRTGRSTAPADDRLRTAIGFMVLLGGLGLGVYALGFGTTTARSVGGQKDAEIPGSPSHAQRTVNESGSVGSRHERERLEYNVLCPQCRNARIRGARKVRFLYGLLVAARHGYRIEIGCEPCLRRIVLGQIGRNLLFGWWCFPWGVFTPLVLLSNLGAIVSPYDDELLRDALGRAGIDPEEVAVYPDGTTREQRTVLRVAEGLLAAAVQADGRADDVEWNAAVDVLCTLSGGTMTREEARRRLMVAKPGAAQAGELRFESRLLLLDAAVFVVGSDGHVAREELSFLRLLNRELAFDDGALDEVLRSRLGGSWAIHESAATDPVDAEYTKACQILGISRGATWVEVRQGYRAAMLRDHPDMAHGDDKLRAEMERRAKEINWAYDVCKRRFATT